MFTGSLVAIVTPFRKGKVDEQALAELIEWQIGKGTNGIVPCGTTGESATLSHDEHNRVIEFTVEMKIAKNAANPRPRIPGAKTRSMSAKRAWSRFASPGMISRVNSPRTDDRL